jgi:probable DNA repair protein
LLAQLLKTFLENKSYTDKIKRTPSQWATQFTEILNLWGWPGERTLDSSEYQLYERFQALTNEFCQLDIILTRIDRQTAIEQFQQLAQATLFQPQSKHPAPIQILGVLESAGLHFDQMWIMGLHNQAWPTTPKPNAFIPIALQRHLQLPHASNERELNFCRTLTQRLLQSAPQVVCSYPQQIADRQLQVSALIKHLPTVTLAELGLCEAPRFPKKIQQTSRLETLTDDYATPVADNEKITGGTHIFKLQAACPFRAFAEIRLDAKRIEEIQLGLNHRQRGNLLHQALEILWKTINNHITLLSYSDETLNNLVNHAIDNTFTLFIQKYPLTFKQQFTQLEKQRLFHLLKQWLELEKQRPPFTVIAIEQSGEYQLANIPLKLRVDRIDQLEDGSYLLIDYKTSQHISYKYWLGERLDEPQLPIYCVTSTLPIKGITFAQLRSSQMQFIGLSENDSETKGIVSVNNIKEESTPKDWNSLLTHWRNDLEKLAQQFRQGYAKVDPKYQEQTCVYCDLSSLCRVKKN